MKSFQYILLVCMLLILSCARRGSPSGGIKDENAPIIISANPTHKSVNFSENEIRINFDEYIKLKDIQKQLIISPPLKYKPVITPLGLPSKRITIKISDTLNPNTTYVFNFGESIEDHNEGNKLSGFKYVFSTGSYIDSLEISGTIKDAFLNKTSDFISVQLYEMNETYNDSTIFKEKPTYITNTLDSLAWKITNIKKGKYRLIALKENDNDYLFKSKYDQIAFIDSVITIPTNKNFKLNLFKETLKFEMANPVEKAKGHLLLGYFGNAKNLKVKPVKINDNLKYISFFDQKKDTLHFFYKESQLDSIKIKFTNTNFEEDKVVKLRLKKIDSLQLQANIKNTLFLKDTFTIFSNHPLDYNIDNAQISLVDKDTINIDFKTKVIKLQQLKILFDSKPNNSYRLKILPNAINDFFYQTNDTLSYKFSTKKENYYGGIKLKVITTNYPILVQLLSEDLELIEEIISNKNEEYNFKNLKPATYIIRVIEDANRNNKWDTGDFIKKLQPEKVYYFSKVLKVRENFYLDGNVFKLE